MDYLYTALYAFTFIMVLVGTVATQVFHVSPSRVKELLKRYYKKKPGGQLRRSRSVLLSSSTLEQNPFLRLQPRKKMSTVYRVFKGVVGYGILLPIRAVLTVLLMGLTVLVVSLSMWGVKRGSKPTAMRSFLISIVALIARILLFVCGFYYIDVVKPKSKETSKPAPIVIGNHTSLVDAIVMFYLFDPACFVSRIENLKLPVVGTILQATQAILVDRTNKNSKKDALEKIKSRALDAVEDKRVAKVVLFPEGTTTNGTALINFKVGAFVPAVPVQPVLIQYPFDYTDISWSCDVSLAATMFAMYGQFSNSLKVTILPPYVPSEEEKMDPSLYASNVRALMASKLDRPLTEHSMEDALLCAEASKLHMQNSTEEIHMAEIRKLYNLGVRDVKGLIKRFAKFDTDKDGVLSVSEFSEMFGLPVNDHTKELFSLFETDALGINFKQFIVGMSLLDKEKTHDDIIEYCFELFKNQTDDGKDCVSAADLEAYMSAVFPGISDKQMRELFSQMDLDSDGEISRDEFFTFARSNPYYIKLVDNIIRKKGLDISQPTLPATS